MKTNVRFTLILISLFGISISSFSQINAEFNAEGDAILKGDIGIGTIPSHRLHIIDNPSISNTISIEADVAPPSSRDILEIIVDKATGDDAQFIELERGNKIVAAVNTDGSAEFKSVEFPDGTLLESAPIGPIAYGFIRSDAEISSGSNNFSAVWNAINNRYEITIDDENYFYRSYSSLVTPVTSSIDRVNTSSVSGKLLIKLYDSSGSNIQGEFQFVTFK